MKRQVNDAGDWLSFLGEADLDAKITIVFYVSGSAVDRVDDPDALFRETVI
jgi:hypothetical protein